MAGPEDRDRRRAPAPGRRRKRRWLLVLVAIPALAAGAWFLGGGSTRAERPGLAAGRVAAAQDRELALPGAPAGASASAAGVAAVSTARVESAPRVAASASPLGALEGRVLLDASFAGARCVALLRRTPRSSSAGEPYERTAPRVYSILPPGGPDLALAFEGVEPGVYELRLVVLPDAESEALAAEETGTRAFHVVGGLEVVAGETDRDPRLDPLDLRERAMLVRLTIVDAFGVPLAERDLRAVAAPASIARARSDRHGRVDFVLPPSAGFVEVELQMEPTCTARAPILPGRSVVVMPDRPEYVLHVDPQAIPAGFELSIFVRESEAAFGDSPLGRGAVWGRFDAGGDAGVTPRRIGLHELEWRVKQADVTRLALIDPEQTLDVRASAGPVYVELALPDAVREALR